MDTVFTITIKAIDIDCCFLCKHSGIDENNRERRYCEMYSIYFERDAIHICDKFEGR